jgi:hypothetical protein
MAAISKSRWVGTVGPTSQAGNQVVTTNGSGIGTVTFPRAYAAAPAVTLTGGNGESLTMVQGVADATTTGFSFYAYTQAGALMPSVSVRVVWVAHPVT